MVQDEELAAEETPVMSVEETIETEVTIVAEEKSIEPKKPVE